MTSLARIATRTVRRTERRNIGSAVGMAFTMNLPSLAGILVTPSTAMTFTAVYSAINTISTDLACLPVGVFRRLPGGGRAQDFNHKNFKLLNVSPDGRRPAMRYRQATNAHILGWGNGYSEIEQDNAGRPLALHLLHPSSTKPLETRKKLSYELRDDERTIAGEKVLHLAGLGFNGLEGYSPIGMAREAIGLGKAAEEFGATFFGNGAVPKGMIESPKALSPEAQGNLRRSLNMVHQGAKQAHQLMILEQGLKWVNTQIAPEEAQFLATRQFQVIEIARMYRLPPNKLGDYSQSHLANIEAANLDYFMTTLAPWCVAIEQEWNLKLFTEAERDQGYFVEHMMGGFLRGDMKSRSAFYKSALNDGWMTRDEVRERENLNPIGTEAGGGIFTVPLNMASLESFANGDRAEPAPVEPTPAADDIAIDLPDDLPDPEPAPPPPPSKPRRKPKAKSAP